MSQEPMKAPDDAIYVDHVDQLPAIFRQHKRLFITRFLPFQDKNIRIWFQKVDHEHALTLINQIANAKSDLHALGFEYD